MNTLKKLASIFALVSAIGVTSCKSGNEVRGIDQPDTYAKILAKYSISESTTVAEFRSISNPNYIIVATDGNHASGIATWEQVIDQVGERDPEILAKYETPAGEVIEFRPASNEGKVCTYVDSKKSGALTCADVLPN